MGQIKLSMSEKQLKHNQKQTVTEDAPKDTSSKKGSILSNLKKYRTEYVITLSTTFILAGLYFQGMGPSILKGFGKNVDPQTIRVLTIALRAPIPQLIFFLVLPVLSLFLIGEPIKKYGFKLGDWKKGLLFVCLSVGALVPLLYWASTMSGFKDYYIARTNADFEWVVIQYGLYMVSWEFLLRGYLYFSLEEKVGSLAVWLQSVPFAIAHLGKPAPEALTCYFGGLVLGYISLKTRSFVYAFLIHWGIYVTLVGFILMSK